MFFITTIRVVDGKVKEKRTPGYSLSLEEAKDWVNRNVGSIDDRIYDYLVIEQIHPGIYSLNLPEDNAQTWYKRNWDEEKWESINIPEFAIGICNWGIG
jgi:hypothetical protein